jgi:hypothetical protein
MLLSNNRVNDLIGLPLDLYAYALQQRECINLGTSPAACNARGDIPEISELATHLLNDVGVDLHTEDIEFPLYARALEFCNSNQDSFVRLTAMNICLNTLRLAAISSHC